MDDAFSGEWKRVDMVQKVIDIVLRFADSSFAASERVPAFTQRAKIYANMKVHKFVNSKMNLRIGFDADYFVVDRVELVDSVHGRSRKIYRQDPRCQERPCTIFIRFVRLVQVDYINSIF